MNQQNKDLQLVNRTRYFIVASFYGANRWEQICFYDRMRDEIIFQMSIA